MSGPGSPGGPPRPTRPTKSRVIDPPGGLAAAPNPGGHKAPFVIYGGIFTIGITCVLLVVVTHCNRHKPYLDPSFVPPGTTPPAQIVRADAGP